MSVLETCALSKTICFLIYIIYKVCRTNNRTKCKFFVNKYLFLIELYMITKIFQHKNFGNKNSCFVRIFYYSPFLPLTARRNPCFSHLFHLNKCAINRRVATLLFWFHSVTSKFSFLVSSPYYKLLLT